MGNYYRTKNSNSSQEEIRANNNQFADYNHLNLHNISKYTKQDIPFETNCPFCKKNVVYHRHFGDCKKTRKNNKIYNLK